MAEETREHFKSRIGFIFVAAGCAIGLGNVWRFPYITGQYGGAAFIVLYLIFLVVLGLPVMVMEFAVGRASQRSTARSFDVLPSKKNFRWFGWWGYVGSMLLLMFYTTICGWMLSYIPKMASGMFNGAVADTTAAAFGASPTRHYEDGAAAISGVASAEEGTVTIPIPGISRAWGDVTIRPGPGKTKLTIPARSGGSEVYGKTVAILRAHGWKFASGRKGTPQEKLLFGRFGDEKESKVMFILKESVVQRRDPSLLPSQGEIADCAGKAIVGYVLDCVRKARRASA